MRVFIVLLCLGLLVPTVQAANNVKIHFNYPSDSIFIGINNTMEIWIENDYHIESFSLGLYLYSYTGQVIWNSSYGDGGFQAENDAVDAFPSAINSSSFFFDQNLPDTINIGGFALGLDYPGLPANSMRACYTLEFLIPDDEEPGRIYVKDILGLNACEWLFFNGTNEITPEFEGCNNFNSYNPNCDPVWFPVVDPPAPIANFSFEPDSGAYPLLVNFTDLSQNYPGEWQWLFGDGGSSSEQNPSHTYTFAGTFFPLLVVSNSSGLDTLFSPIPLKVTTPQAPTGIFLTCPAIQETYGDVTDTVIYVVENNSEYPGNFNFMVNDSLGWFISPTFYQFQLEAYSLDYINVEVLVPDGLGLGVQNKLTGSVVSQTNPLVNDTAICRIVISDGMCGDVNLDGNVNVSDAVYIINYVFMGGPAPCEQIK